MSRNDALSSAGLTRRGFATLPAAAGLAAAGNTPRWTIFVVQHSHIDVGYTERQEIVASQHADFVRQALEFALSPAQKDRAPDCRFKFTCEGFWQVEQFLARASAEDRRRLVRAMKDGVMELTACYFHLTELPDQEMLRRSLGFAVEFARREGIPLLAAMGCDINGLSWGMADALAEAGVRYLSMNVNHHHGGYPFGRPLVPFYWESPSGKRVLAWNGLTYHKANLFGLMGGPTPDADPGVPGFTLPGANRYLDIRDTSVAERKLLPFLDWLEKSGYPYDFLPMMGSGLHTDNSPAGEEYCSIIRQWNEKHGSRVHLRTATLAEFFRHLEKHAKSIPVHRGEWTDWWSDGVAATPLDTLVFRNAQRNRRVIDMLDPRRETVPPARLTEIDKKLLLYAEHTFGYSQTSTPSLFGHQVFIRKTKHAVDADEMSTAALDAILRRKGEGPFADRRPMEYKVLNPLRTPVRAAVYLPLENWEQSIVRAGFRVVDAAGKVVPHQVEPRPRGFKIAVVLEMSAGEERELRLEAAPAPAPAGAGARDAFENAFYRVAWQEGKGLTEFTGRAGGQGFVDLAAGGSIGCPVYQVFPNGSRSAAGAVRGKRVRPRDETTIGQCTAIKRAAAGSVYERWEFRYQVPGAAEYTLAATFFHHLPQIELRATLLKTDVRDPEGMYVLFPLAVKDGVWHLDKPGAPVRPGLDQLPDACCDYYCLQHGAALCGPEGGVAVTTLDAPLVHVGAMRLWNYSTRIEPRGPLYSWLTNNKWETNFRISCGGAYEFRYILQGGRELADAQSALSLCRALSYPPLVTRK